MEESHSAKDELWDLSKGDIDPEEIKKLALLLANGKISLSDFEEKVEDLQYTGYSMRKGEMGHAWNQANDQFDESAPSSGLSKKEKSKVSKQAKAGKDIGKPGKKFADVAEKSAKKYGSEEAGKRVAAAAMWKTYGGKKGKTQKEY